MTLNKQAGGAGITILIIVVLLILAGILFYTNRDASDVAPTEETPAEEVAGAEASMEEGDAMMEEGDEAAAADDADAMVEEGDAMAE